MKFIKDLVSGFLRTLILSLIIFSLGWWYTTGEFPPRWGHVADTAQKLQKLIGVSQQMAAQRLKKGSAEASSPQTEKNMKVLQDQLAQATLDLLPVQENSKEPNSLAARNGMTEDQRIELLETQIKALTAQLTSLKDDLRMMKSGL